MRNCLYILLFLVLTLTIPTGSAYAYGDGGGGGGGGGSSDGSGGGGDAESTTSDTGIPPTGFTPATSESAGSDITTSSETDPGNEEEVAELVDEVNSMGETSDAEEEDSDSDEEAASDETESGEDDDGGEDDSGSDEETASNEDSTDDNQGDSTDEETETAIGDIDPHGNDQAGGTTGQPSKPGPSLIGTQGTLPGTRSATLEAIETEINEDGSVSSWAEYSNDTWVHTTVRPDGTTEVVVHLESGTMIRPGQEFIHSGGSVNPLLDWTIAALETAAAAGTVAGWVLTVTPTGFLAGAGIKATQATWGATVGIQAVRAGADVYGTEIEKGASQSEAALSGVQQTVVNAAVTTATGKFLADPYKDAVGEVTGDVGHAVAESAINQLANVEAAGLTEAATGTNPGYGPGLF
ncbi:MAG TPA: hypothetical protein PLA74_07180 [Syntrophales bacterium]|nr:hypothetical protein [Syntrophales bacterium]HPQ45181.1 hypothetical protein [Syntrophales bacterium]